MRQHVADSAHSTPRNLGPRVRQLVGNRAARFGDDLDCALHQPAQLPACFKIDKRSTLRNLLDAFDGFQNIMNRVTNLAGHQKIRTAVCSISALSKGWRPSRVVTSTGTLSSSSRYCLMPTRSKALKRPFGS